MNTLLWTLQIILAIKLLTVTFHHGLRPDPLKMQRGKDRFGRAARPLLITIAGLALLTALGLVLPTLGGYLPCSASASALMMLIGSGFHLRCREEPKVWVTMILFGLAAFLAYGRFFLVQL